MMTEKEILKGYGFKVTDKCNIYQEDGNRRACILDVKKTQPDISIVIFLYHSKEIKEVYPEYLRHLN